MKTESKDFLIIDILLANTNEHQKVITNSFTAESKIGNIPISTKQDLIWLKSFRNSPQDQVDINKLSND